MNHSQKFDQQYTNGQNMKFWQLTVGLGLGFLLFMSVFTSENERIVLRSSLINPLAHQPNLVQQNESNTETQYFYTDKNQFLVIHPQGIVDLTDQGLEIKQGDVFIAGGLNEMGQEMVKIGGMHFDVSNKQVLVSIDQRQSNVHIYAIDASVGVLFDQSDIPLFIPVGHKAVIPPDRYFLQQPNAFLSEQLNQFFSVEPWYEDVKTNFIQDDRVAFEAWLARFESYALQWPLTWSNGKTHSFSAQIGYQLSRMHERITIGMSDEKKHVSELVRIMSYVVDGLYFFNQENMTKLEQTSKKLVERTNSSDWQIFLRTTPEYARKWNEYKKVFYFWVRNQPQTSPERSLLALFEPIDDSPIMTMKQEWIDVESNLARFFLQRANPHLINIKNISQKYLFTEDDRNFLMEKRYLLYRLLLEYPFFQKTDFFVLYDIWARADIRLTSSELLPNKKLIIASEIRDLAASLIERETDPRISKIMLDLWSRLEVEPAADKTSFAVISEEDVRLIENLRLTGGQKIEADEIKAIEATLQFEQELEDRLAAIENELEIEIDGKQNDIKSDLIENPSDFLGFLNEFGIQSDLLNFRTSREKGTSAFEKFIYKDRFISGLFEYESQRFLNLVLSSGEEYQSVSRIAFSDILTAIDASIELERSRLDELETKAQEMANKNEGKIMLESPNSTVIQTTEKAVLSRRFSQRMLSTLPLELQRHNIVVLDDSYQIFGVWNAASGRAIKLAFTFDQVNGKFSDIKWVEQEQENDPEELFTRNEILNWDDFEAWLIGLQPIEDQSNQNVSEEIL